MGGVHHFTHSAKRCECTLASKSRAASGVIISHTGSRFSAQFHEAQDARRVSTLHAAFAFGASEHSVDHVTRYAPEQLQRIFEQIAGTGLWIPQQTEQPTPVGPTFSVYLKHSEIFGDGDNVQDEYWRLLQQAPVVNAIGVLASISNVLTLTARDPDAHRALHEQFLTIDNLTLPEFVAIVFGLYAFGNKVVQEGINRVVFEPAALLREFPNAQQLLDRFLQGRALNVDELTDSLRRGAPRTREEFLNDLANRNVLTTSLSVFRQYPLLRLDDGRIVILDLQFLTDLLTTGIYWLLFDSVPPERRETFRELWGRVRCCRVLGRNDKSKRVHRPLGFNRFAGELQPDRNVSR